MIKDKGASAFANLYISDASGRREERKDTISGIPNWHPRELALEEERWISGRRKVEMPVSCEVGKNTFFGTTANLSDDGMMIESSLARENVRRILKTLLKTDECLIKVDYFVRGKSFSRPGKIRHFHLDFSGAQSACRFSFGVWIPKLRLRDERWL